MCIYIYRERDRCTLIIMGLFDSRLRRPGLADALEAGLAR